MFNCMTSQLPIFTKKILLECIISCTMRISRLLYDSGGVVHHKNPNHPSPDSRGVEQLLTNRSNRTNILLCNLFQIHPIVPNILFENSFPDDAVFAFLCNR